MKSNHILIGLCDWFTCENLISKKFVMIMLEHIRSSHLSKRKEGHNNIIRYISHFGEITLSDIFVPPHTPATPSHRSPLLRRTIITHISRWFHVRFNVRLWLALPPPPPPPPPSSKRGSGVRASTSTLLKSRSGGITRVEECSSPSSSSSTSSTSPAGPPGFRSVSKGGLAWGLRDSDAP